MILFQRIKEFLDQHAISYIVKEHAPTTTSEESAKARGESIKIGAKALLLKMDSEFILAILPADRQLDTGKFKKIMKSKNLRFANADELTRLTGCPKGAVPPFGFLFGLNMIVDEALFEEEYMAFNAGSLEISIKTKTEDYRMIVKPREGQFSTAQSEK